MRTDNQASVAEWTQSSPLNSNLLFQLIPSNWRFGQKSNFFFFALWKQEDTFWVLFELCMRGFKKKVSNYAIRSVPRIVSLENGLLTKFQIQSQNSSICENSCAKNKSATVQPMSRLKDVSQTPTLNQNSCLRVGQAKTGSAMPRKTSWNGVKQ